jgi:hypothetical protein
MTHSALESKESAMKRHVLGLVVASALATAYVGAQSSTAPPTTPPQQQQQEEQKQQQPEVTVTGCVIQGSAPTVFILDNARTNPEDRNEKGKTYVLVASAEDLRLGTHLNQEVRVTGLAEDKTAPVPPPGQKVAEKDLPKFTAKSVTMVADRCTTAGR